MDFIDTRQAHINIRRMTYVAKSAFVDVCICLLVAIATGGCSNPSASGPGATVDAYVEATRDFGEKILADDWVGAYEMTSANFRERFSLERFINDHTIQRKEYHEEGTPLGLGPVYEEDIEEVAEDYEDLPEGIPTDPPVRMYSYARVALEGSLDDIERCYTIDLYWVEESGAPKVTYYEYMWCD